MTEDNMENISENIYEIEEIENVAPFNWPPQFDDDSLKPTASPLYIPPPGTQHIQTKHLIKSEQTCEQSLMSVKKAYEVESCSESNTSTCTTTTFSSADEYQRNYQMYSNSSFTDDYQDYEIAAMQHNKMSLCSAEVNEITGRRSAQECVENISSKIDSQLLMDVIKESSPRPSSPIPRLSKRIEFTNKLEHEEEQCTQGVQTEVKEAEIIDLKSETNEFNSSNEIQNNNPKGYQSELLKALSASCEKPYRQLNTPTIEIEDTSKTNIVDKITMLGNEKKKSSFLTSLLTTAPSAPLEFVSKISTEEIPLPEETVPYIPEPFNIKPNPRSEDDRPRSPFLRALITAPIESYCSFPKEVPNQLDDLPTPKEKLTMRDALTVASERSYTPLSPIDENNSNMVMSFSISEPKYTAIETLSQNVGMQQANYAKEYLEEQSSDYSLNSFTEKQISAFANVKGVRSVNPFQPRPTAIDLHFPARPSMFVATAMVQQNSFISNDQLTQIQNNLSNQTVSTENVSEEPQQPPPPPPKRGPIKSGLHAPDAIPGYQKHLEKLPTQSPHKPPKPFHLKENVPIAFLETPIDQPPYNHRTRFFSSPTKELIEQEESCKMREIIDSTQFCALEQIENQQRSTTPLRPLTPSQINKPAPIVPYYQKNLIPVEYPATQSIEFDPKSRSPTPNLDHPKCKAVGPPPNPLDSLYPKVSENLGNNPIARIESKNLNTSSIQQTAGISTLKEKSGMTQQRIGNTNIETKFQESQLHEEAKRHTQKSETLNVGNVQIQRRTRVVEEHEHERKEKSIEIRKGSGNVRSASLDINGQPRQGIVASQVKQISLTSQGSNNANKVEKASKHVSILQSTKEESTHFPTSPVFKEPLDHFPSVSYNSKVEIEANLPNVGYNLLSPYGVSKSVQAKIDLFSSAASSAIVNTNSNTTATIEKPDQNNNNAKLTSKALTVNEKTPISKQIKPPMLKATESLISKPIEPSPKPSLLKPNPVSNPSFKPYQSSKPEQKQNPYGVSDPSPASAGSPKGGAFGATSAPRRGRGTLNKAVGSGVRVPLCGCCSSQIRGPFITALGRIWAPDHFTCTTSNCKRPLQDIGFVEEKGQLYCEFCFEKYLAPNCTRCAAKIKGDCLNAIGKHFHPECFTCAYCGKLFGNSPFFLEEGDPYCQADWNELFTTKCFACGFPVEAGDRWVEALNNNYHSQCFNCSMCKKNLEGQSFVAKGGRPFCKNHGR